jgi:hypothetical protein
VYFCYIYFNTDLNECLLGTYQCNSTQTCSNQPGSYDCVCGTNQVDDGGICRGKWINVLSAALVDKVTGNDADSQYVLSV